MIWLDDNGHIVMRSNYKHKSSEDIVNYQKSIIHLLQTQNSDCFNEDTTYNALDLLENLLFEPSQVNVEDLIKKEISKEFASK